MKLIYYVSILMKRLSCYRKRIKYKIFLNRIGIYKKEKKKLLSLHKLGGVSAILSKLYCAQLALTLHKLGAVQHLIYEDISRTL